MNGAGAGWKEANEKNMKFYEVEIAFISREGDTIKVRAKCPGQAEKLALEIAEDLNPHGEEFEINCIEEIIEENNVR